MQEYISKQQQDFASRGTDLRGHQPFRQPHARPLPTSVEEWQATEDSCSFKAKGFTVKLRMEEREPGKYVKVVGDDGGVPMDFAFWIQLHEVSAADTRLRLVLHIELNMMMKMMIGGKLQGAHRPDRRRHRSRDARRPAGRTDASFSGADPAGRARLRRHDAPTRLHSGRSVGCSRHRLKNTQSQDGTTAVPQAQARTRQHSWRDAYTKYLRRRHADYETDRAIYQLRCSSLPEAPGGECCGI